MTSRSTVALAFWGWALGAGCAAAPAPRAPAQPAPPPVEATLPAVPVDLVTGPLSEGECGRLAIELGGRVVPIDHPFRSGDRIKLVIASSRDGWVFIQHSDSGQKPQPLWPLTGQFTSENFVGQNRPRAFPSDSVIEFDEATANERFYVAIVSRPTPAAPVVSAKAGPGPSSASKAGGEETDNGAVGTYGGVQVAVDAVSRGVHLRRDPRDPFVTFQAGKAGAEVDDGIVAAVEFTLHHVAQ